MRKWIVGAGCLALLLLVFSGSEALAQNTLPNGDFELQAAGSWDLTGNNNGAMAATYDVTGLGSSWCWKRQPGSDQGNGGLTQAVYLLDGLTYDFSMDVCFICTC